LEAKAGLPRRLSRKNSNTETGITKTMARTAKARLMAEVERLGFYEEVRRLQSDPASIKWLRHDEVWNGL
jgi:hypothetical protein